MTKTEDRVNDIIAELVLSVTDTVTPNDLAASEKAKQAITDWHNKRETSRVRNNEKRILLARIDTLEYAKISPKFKIEERIEQLKQELKKYE